MMQESKNSGFGALSGQVDSDSYVRKNRGRTKEGKLERITAILGFLFFVVAIGLCLKVFQWCLYFDFSGWSDVDVLEK